eukprot:7560451-Alexandrium_andersonii.AAC.1
MPCGAHAAPRAASTRRQDIREHTLPLRSRHSPHDMPHTRPHTHTHKNSARPDKLASATIMDTQCMLKQTSRQYVWRRNS